MVEEAGSALEEWAGARVVVDPIISCFVRGLDPCPACLDGLPALCRHAADGSLSPGMLIGYCRDLPGAWSEAMLAHASQLHRVPDARLATRPRSWSSRSPARCTRCWPRRRRRGRRCWWWAAGRSGSACVLALRMMDPEADVTAVVRHPRAGQRWRSGWARAGWSRSRRRRAAARGARGDRRACPSADRRRRGPHRRLRPRLRRRRQPRPAWTPACASSRRAAASSCSAPPVSWSTST